VPPNGGRGFFGNVQDALQADLQMGNLEEPITNDTGVTKCGAGSSGCHAFRAPPSYVRALTEAGFDLMNLANNHARDFGAAGEEQTKATLTGAGIKYTGPPGVITTTTVKGIKVAAVGFAPYAWANSLTDIPGAAELVRKAKTQADIVVVQAHVGAEGADKTHVRPGTEYFLGENRGDSIAFGHAVVDAGADIVIMHGPHVMRGMEFYKGHLIAYSMGNFAGYHALSTGGVLGISGVLRVTLDANGRFVAGKLIATQMVSPGVPRLDPNHRAWSQVRSLSRSDFPSTAAKIGTDGTITVS
jgi:poly-gamma-glutamate capsule biosynthesis protein CapA/YwtB (metallophosphatase superfamily)